MRKKQIARGEDAPGTYDVGYRKPPTVTRFKPGKSGNPKGRPKGIRNFRSDLKATLVQPVKLTREGRPHRISTQEAVLLRLREKALSGDARALDRLIALAQAYNDDEVPTSSVLTEDDSALVEVFRRRILSGAADDPKSK